MSNTNDASMPDLSKAILAENIGATDGTPDPEVDLSEAIIAESDHESAGRGVDGEITAPGDGLDSDLLPPSP